MPLKKLFARRLLKLADLLDHLPRNRFDFDRWTGFEYDARGKSQEELDDLCGTTGCALGWATTIPALRRAGLKLDEYGDPIAGQRGGSYAAVGILTETQKQADQLFLPGNAWEKYKSPLPPTATPKQVAKHIRRKVAEWSEER